MRKSVDLILKVGTHSVWAASCRAPSVVTRFLEEHFIRQLVPVAFLFGLTVPAVAENIRYEAVWHQDQQTSLVSAPLTRSNFVSTGTDLAESGLRLIDVETIVHDGRRLYAGLWTQGSGTNLFDGPMGPIDMRETMEDMRDRGLRLVDFEIFRRANGGRLYIGVWRPGSGEEILTGPMEEDAFFARGENLTADGLRLIDVEVERIDGTLLYSGLFRTGTGSNFLTAPLSRMQFQARRDQMVADGLELVDVETIRIGATQRFVGVWASGDGESRLSLPREFVPFFVFAQAQFNDGKHSVDFEFRHRPHEPVDEPDPDPNPPPGDPPTAELPDNRPEFFFHGDQVLRVRWLSVDDELFRIELPLSWLPPWLPMKDGEPVLPETFCALNIRRADAIHWQVPGDPAVATPPFLSTPSVSALGSNHFNGGVHFEGPFGSCSGTQTDFVFNFPFTTGEVPFEPLENMELVIEGVGSTLPGGTVIDFMAAGAPEGEVLKVDELFEDDTMEQLEALTEQFAELFEEGEDVEEYCEEVGEFWGVFCTQFPGACPEPVTILPSC